MWRVSTATRRVSPFATNTKSVISPEAYWVSFALHSRLVKTVSELLINCALVHAVKMHRSILSGPKIYFWIMRDSNLGEREVDLHLRRIKFPKTECIKINAKGTSITKQPVCKTFTQIHTRFDAICLLTFAI